MSLVFREVQPTWQPDAARRSGILRRSASSGVRNGDEPRRPSNTVANSESNDNPCVCYLLTTGHEPWIKSKGDKGDVFWQLGEGLLDPSTTISRSLNSVDRTQDRKLPHPPKRHVTEREEHNTSEQAPNLCIHVGLPLQRRAGR